MIFTNPWQRVDSRVCIKCIDCGYDLRAHLFDERCPECSARVSRSLQPNPALRVQHRSVRLRILWGLRGMCIAMVCALMLLAGSMMLGGLVLLLAQGYTWPQRAIVYTGGALISLMAFAWLTYFVGISLLATRNSAGWSLLGTWRRGMLVSGVLFFPGCFIALPYGLVQSYMTAHVWYILDALIAVLVLFFLGFHVWYLRQFIDYVERVFSKSSQSKKDRSRWIVNVTKIIISMCVLTALISWRNDSLPMVKIIGLFVILAGFGGVQQRASTIFKYVSEQCKETHVNYK